MTCTSVDIGAGPVIGECTPRPWLHVNAVGADFPGKVEIPRSLLGAALVVPDIQGPVPARRGVPADRSRRDRTGAVADRPAARPAPRSEPGHGLRLDRLGRRGRCGTAAGHLWRSTTVSARTSCSRASAATRTIRIPRRLGFDPTEISHRARERHEAPSSPRPPRSRVRHRRRRSDACERAPQRRVVPLPRRRRRQPERAGGDAVSGPAGRSSGWRSTEPPTELLAEFEANLPMLQTYADDNSRSAPTEPSGRCDFDGVELLFEEGSDAERTRVRGPAVHRRPGGAVGSAGARGDLHAVPRRDPGPQQHHARRQRLETRCLRGGDQRTPHPHR